MPPTNATPPTPSTDAVPPPDAVPALTPPTDAVPPAAAPVDVRGLAGRVRHLRVALGVCAAFAVPGAIGGALLGGADSALGFVAGVVLVAASYTASTLAIAWADTVNPRMVFPVGMAMYVTKFSLFGALLIFIGGAAWGGTIAMALGIVAGVIAWTGTQIWWTVKTAYPYVPQPGFGLPPTPEEPGY